MPESLRPRLAAVAASAALALLALAPGARALVAQGASAAAAGGALPRPPVAVRVPHVDTLHGEVRRDPYFYMKDRRDARVLTYLHAENAYADALTGHTAALRDSLYREMLGRLKQTDLTVPYRKGDWWYYSRTEEGKSYPILARKRGSLDAREEVLLDQNQLAEGKKYFGLGGVDVSPDGRRLLYLADTTAYREYTLYVKDLDTGRLVDSLRNVWNGTAWADDNRTFFYTTADSAKRGNAIWRHVTGRRARRTRTCSARTRCCTTWASRARGTAAGCSSARRASRRRSGAPSPRRRPRPPRASWRRGAPAWSTTSSRSTARS
jgi:oligopeptidase B